MKKLLLLYLTIIAMFFTHTTIAATGNNAALLILVHGSPNPAWNNTALAFEQQIVAHLASGDNPFQAVRVAFMEMNKPDIATVVKELENSGIKRILAMPLFIAPSGHSMNDIPTILGLYSDLDMVQILHKEGIEIVNTDIKIVLGPALDHSNLHELIMLDRVKELSTDPASEGIILLAHGCPEFAPVWQSLCQDIGEYICAKTGITKFNYAFIEVGQSFETEGLPKILAMADDVKRTIVVGLYLALTPQQIASRYIAGEKMDADYFKQHNIYFSEKALLPDTRIVTWLADYARQLHAVWQTEAGK